MMMLQLKHLREIEAKTILTKSGLPGADWVINPYNGCSFGCMYCYAAQIGRWKHPDEVWGEYVDVKIHAPELLQKELSAFEKKCQSKNFGTIFFSSVTDPYMGLEAKYRLTRSCLEVLADFKYEGEICIQTKSPLVTRDIDILSKFIDSKVGFTITTLDDKVSRFLEVAAPPASARIKALEDLYKAGIKTYAFVGPLLPSSATKENIMNILDELTRVGISEVWFEHINLQKNIKERLFAYLKTEAPELIVDFEKTETAEYRENLNKIILEAMEGRPFKMALGKVIFHGELPKKK